MKKMLLAVFAVVILARADQLRMLPKPLFVPMVPIFGPGQCMVPPVKPPKPRITTASWYGPGFHGRRTANGEIFDMYQPSAASRTLKFGTLLFLVNPRNGRSLLVRINDRGPYDPRQLPELKPHPRRDLDLSWQAANMLGITRQGVARLQVRQVSY